MKTSKLRDITAVFAKIMEVIGWIGVGLFAISFGLVFIFRKEIETNLTDEIISTHFTAPGYNLENLSVAKGNIIPVILVLVAFGLITGFLLALMFRNVNKVFKTTNTDSPFAEINVKRIKTIGYIAISFPIIKVIANIILGFFLKNVVIGLELSEVLFGLIILCLSQYFAYGASLEKDVNGLL